jgi:hypothetical protein
VLVKTDPDLVFIVGSTGVKRSDDFGLSWTETRLTPNWIGWRPFDNVEISIADPQVVWATSRMDYDPPSRRTGGIHVSSDGGLSFTNVSANLPPDVFESSGLGTHPLDGQTAYLLFSLPGQPKILQTTDLGATFTDLSGFSGIARTGFSGRGFPDVAVFSLLVMPFDTNQLWAGTEIGLFISEDGGQSWAYADNGLPAVAIFQMRIVDDEVVVATQGRGIWSVALPELADHEPPSPTLAPRLNALVMNPRGFLPIDIDLRSAYDSTQIWLDGALLETVPANPEPTSIEFPVPVTSFGTVTAQAYSFSGGREFRSAERSGQVYPVDVAAAYTNDFADPSRDLEFTGNGFQMAHSSGFVDRALHTAHPYAPNSDVIIQLVRPIRVQEQDATLRYSDVVLVEKGVSNDWTDPNFWDYVVVEGTEDGTNWVPLAPGYDSRAELVWSTAYDQWPSGDGGSNAEGNGSMFIDHTINLLDSFDPGATIFIRFRLYSDPAVVAWGWAIDDIVIQPDAVKIAQDGSRPVPEPLAPALGPNVPNPFNPSTEISFTLPRRARVRLGVFDLAGRLVKRLVANQPREAGEHRVTWDGRDDHGRAVASGVYLYRMQTDEFERVRKMTLLK